MSATATAICPFCRHEATAPAQLSGLQAQCPNCANLYMFTPVEPTAVFSGAETIDDERPLVLRIARRRVMHIHCPNCDCDLRLNHTKWVRLRKAHLARLKRKKRKALLKKVLAQRAAAGFLPTGILETAESREAPAPPREIQSPADEPRVRVAAGIEAAPAESSLVARRRRRAAEADERQPSAALEWLVPAVMLLISAAIFCTPFSLVAPVVLPLAGVGCLSALAILIAAARRHEYVARSAATFAYGAVVLLLVLFVPGFFGSNYRGFRQRVPSADVVQVIPKRGQPATDIPKDSDWVDASRYALERNHVTVEIVSVTVGKVEVRSGGALKMSAEPFLVISLRRRRTSDGEEFAAGVRGRQVARDTELTMNLTDNLGSQYARQPIDLGWNNAGLARASTVFPVSTTDDVVAFAAPAADVESLRLEISSPQLGSGPLRFTIPKSMIVRQPR
jgi:hypothetical protein